ncbi:MAG: hypothetical protein H7306_06080 [Bacteriovorax sp.]|nr:hypothetical protein [Rhizobacter sp.]
MFAASSAPQRTCRPQAPQWAHPFVSNAARTSFGSAPTKYAGEVDLAELLKDLRERVEKVQGGNMQPVEAMLFGQAMTLETISTSLARRAASNEGLKQFQVNLTLALKAQAQCRATLETLAEIKNPRPVAFVKQANISGGHQQINNGVSAENRTVPAGAHSHAEEISGQQNELLEAPHGNELDTRAQSTSGGADSHLEAVAVGHRAAYP